MTPSPRSVFDTPEEYWNFLTQSSDDDFEGQHFERKEIPNATTATSSGILKNQLKEFFYKLAKTISAFSNGSIEGGLIVLGIASDGNVNGIDHLSEKQLNTLLNFENLLHSHAVEVKTFQTTHLTEKDKTICFIYASYTEKSICETTGQSPKAWIRRGAQNIQINQNTRDQIKYRKGILDFENTPCCPFNDDEIANDVLSEFRRVFRPESTSNFDVERLLFEAGAIVQHNGEYWFTNAGLLFFGSNPQRLFPAAYIRLLRFDVSSDQFITRGLSTFDQSFTGPITKQIRETRTFFRESGFFKRFQKRKIGGGFTDEPEFPPTVIDEAIVNATAHRDYRTGIPIECEAYSDALIVKNPGRMLQRNHDLPNEFSLSNTVLNSMPRNTKLLEWLRLMKDPDGIAYVQAISEGTKEMLQQMMNLGLPAPNYRLAENETLIKLESKAEERAEAIRAASKFKSTEFSNLFPLRIRQRENLVSHNVFNNRYREFMNTFRDVLTGSGWYIDKFGYGRIVAHRRGSELEIPNNIRSILRMYPAYEFQIRQYFEHYYLSVDYKCQVNNIQNLAAVGQRFPNDELINRRCIAKHDQWKEGRIVEVSSEFAKVHLFDTDSDEQLPVNLIIPYCSISMIKALLDQSGTPFDLSTAIKRHSFASKTGSAKERFERLAEMIQYVADSISPIQFGDLEVDIIPEPLPLGERGNSAKKSLSVFRLPEPTVEFREHQSSSNVRTGITEYGTYDDNPHNIEIVPICLNSMHQEMLELIERLKFGKYKYRGAERTFSTKFSYSSIVDVNQIESIPNETERLLTEHSDWKGNNHLKRIFLVHTPEYGYSRDDHRSPYYVIKRILLENGIPCQMVDTPTLQNPDWKDLNLALNIVAKCGITPWVLPDAIPDADFFVGLSYTQSRDMQRIMGSASVFNSYGKWEFYSGNTSYFKFEERTYRLGELVKKTLLKLKELLSPTPKIVFHYSAKLSKDDRNSILEAAQTVIANGTFTFVWINSHHNVRFYDNRPETDGSLRRGSYVEAKKNQIYLSTTGYNPYRQALGTPKPLEISAWVERPKGLSTMEPDLRALAVQVLNLTKLNWASSDSFCGEPITLKFAHDIAYLTAAFLRQSEPFQLHPVLEATPWFI